MEDYERWKKAEKDLKNFEEMMGLIRQYPVKPAKPAPPSPPYIPTKFIDLLPN